jgi:hypothetical protein
MLPRGCISSKLLILFACPSILYFALLVGWVAAEERIPGACEKGPCVLIASQQSEFKNAVVEHLQDSLESRFTLETVPLSALRKVDESEWDTVIIIQSVKMGKLNRHVRRFLEHAADQDRIVVLTTSGSAPPTDTWGIDTVTAASEKDDAGEVTQVVLSQLSSVK